MDGPAREWGSKLGFTPPLHTRTPITSYSRSTPNRLSVRVHTLSFIKSSLHCAGGGTKAEANNGTRSAIRGQRRGNREGRQVSDKAKINPVKLFEVFE